MYEPLFFFSNAQCEFLKPKTFEIFFLLFLVVFFFGALGTGNTGFLFLIFFILWPHNINKMEKIETKVKQKHTNIKNSGEKIDLSLF